MCRWAKFPWQLLISLLALAAPWPGAAQQQGASTIAGPWTYESGFQMQVQPSDVEGLQARYTFKNGRIFGRLQDGRLQGFWVQSTAGRKCSTERDGSAYWGRLDLVFGETSYEGQWGYCDEALGSRMRGKRIDPTVSPPPQTAASRAADPVVLAAAAATAFQPEPAVTAEEDPFGLAGEWSYEQIYNMRIDRVAPAFRARYDLRHGRIIGQLQERHLDGIWVQDEGHKPCSETREGSRHWGRIVLDFDLDEYRGRWSYCDAEPAKKMLGKRTYLRPGPTGLGPELGQHDMRHLPTGKILPMGFTHGDSLPDLAHDYGIKREELSKFDQRLRAVMKMFAAVPSLNPVRGCNAEITSRIDNPYNRLSPLARKQAIRGYLILGCYKLYKDEAASKKKGSDVWEAESETLPLLVNVNNLNTLMGAKTWMPDGDELNPFNRLFLEPIQVGSIQGLPLLADYWNQQGQPSELRLLVTRFKGPWYQTVGREEFLKVLIADLDYRANSIYLRRQRPIPADVQAERASYAAQLAALTTDQKQLPACYLDQSGNSSWNQVAFKGNVPIGTRDCRPVVKLHPEFSSGGSSRSAVRFLTVERFEDMSRPYLKASTPGARDAMSDSRVSLDMVIQANWPSVLQWFDQP